MGMDICIYIEFKYEFGKKWNLIPLHKVQSDETIRYRFVENFPRRARLFDIIRSRSVETVPSDLSKDLRKAMHILQLELEYTPDLLWLSLEQYESCLKAFYQEAPYESRLEFINSKSPEEQKLYKHKMKTDIGIFNELCDPEGFIPGAFSLYNYCQKYKKNCWLEETVVFKKYLCLLYQET